MKIQLLSLLAVSVVLAGCKVTPQPKVQRTLLNHEKVIEVAERKVTANKQATQDEKYSLASLYISSKDQDVRAKAKPVLESLIKTGHEKARVMLAINEYLGNLGYVSKSLFVSLFSDK